MDAELPRQCVHADAVRAGCSDSVHFLVRETCSRSFLWFRRRADQRVVGLAVGLCIGTGALIPRGNQPLNPWSPVPAVLHCVHQRTARSECRFRPGFVHFCARHGANVGQNRRPAHATRTPNRQCRHLLVGCQQVTNNVHRRGSVISEVESAAAEARKHHPRDTPRW